MASLLSPDFVFPSDAAVLHNSVVLISALSVSTRVERVPSIDTAMVSKCVLFRKTTEPSGAHNVGFEKAFGSCETPPLSGGPSSEASSALFTVTRRSCQDC